LKIASILFFICLQYFGLCQKNDTLPRKDYLIQFSEVNFHSGDSIHPFTLFVEPNGAYYFREEFVDSAFESTSWFRKEGNDWFNSTNVYKQRSDSTLDVINFFPLLISHDSSFINGYPFEYEPLNLIYELNYSFVLKNLSEPSLFYANDKRTLRIVFPAEGIENFGRYYTIRIEFNKATRNLTYSGVDFDSDANLDLLEHLICTIQGEKLLKIEEAIKKVDFEEEQIFSVADGHDKFLIEYRTGNKYYVLRRSIDYSFKGGRDRFMNLYTELNVLVRSCSEENVIELNKHKKKNIVNAEH